MKLTQKLLGTALLATVAVGAASGINSSVKAADTSRTGDAEIEFTAKSYSSDTSGVVPPDQSTQSTTDTRPLPDGSFIVQGMSKLVFASQEVTTGAVTSFAKPTTANDGATDGTAVPRRANWVQFKDERLVDNHSYKLSAKISQPFTQTDTAAGKTRTIKGATIQYSNPDLQADEANEALKPTVAYTKMDPLKDTGEVVDIFTNDDSANASSKGAGKYALYFGNTLKDTDDKSIELNIPQNQAEQIFTGKYKAEITWILSDSI
ncbi:WxL domain-containing protein [Enterococcus sp. LJL99]